MSLQDNPSPSAALVAGRLDSAPESAKARISYIDGARGYLLSMMYLAHTHYTLENSFFKLHHGNFIPAMDAEFFVLISGFVCALAYSGKHKTSGMTGTLLAVLSRLKWVYLFQVMVAVLMILLFRMFGSTIVDPTYTADFTTPLTAQIFAAVRFVYQPPYLDILMLYIALMLFIPLATLLLSKNRVISYFAIIAGLWLFVETGLAAQSDQIVKSIFAYDRAFALRGYFQPLSYAALFYVGFYFGFIQKNKATLPGASLLKKPPVVLFWASLGIILVAIVSCLIWLKTGHLEWLAAPERQSISVPGFLTTLSVTYVVFFLMARTGYAKLTDMAGNALQSALSLPFLTLLGRNSLFTYAIHALIIFIVSYAIITTGHADSIVWKASGLVAGYLLILLFSQWKQRHLPFLP